MQAEREGPEMQPGRADRAARREPAAPWRSARGGGAAASTHRWRQQLAKLATAGRGGGDQGPGAGPRTMFRGLSSAPHSRSSSRHSAWPQLAAQWAGDQAFCGGGEAERRRGERRRISTALGFLLLFVAGLEPLRLQQQADMLSS